MGLEKKFEQLSIIRDSIYKDKEEILENWLEMESSNSFSKKIFNKKSKHILKIFGKKILEHLFDLVTKNKKYGIFDTVVLIMDYFVKKRNFNLVDMYRNYSDLKNVTLFYYLEKYPDLKDKFYYQLAYLFDRNYIVFMNEFLLDNYNDFIMFTKENEKDLEGSIEVSKDKNFMKLKQLKEDIRFTNRDKVSAVEFVEDLDYFIFDKVDFMLEDIDQVLILIYLLDEVDEVQNLLNIIENINQYLYEIIELLIALGVFEIIERAFESLIEFLSKEDMEKILINKEKKLLLVNLLIALINDFENWLKVIFLEKSAQDIHYFDASFAANISKIEKVFVEDTKKEGKEDDECEFEFF